MQRLQEWIDTSIGRRRLGIGILALIVLYLLSYPVLPGASNYVKSVFISGFFFAILSSSWALLAGVAGQFSFGHMAFMGIGAYTAGLLGQYGFQLLGASIAPDAIPPVLGIIIGTLMSGVIGLLIGALCLRLRAAYLALFTIAFSELFRIVVLTEFQITGGNNGLSMRALVEMESITTTRNVNYYIMFAALIGCLVLMSFILNSRVGLFLKAMREDDEAASALGVDIVRYKVFIFVITGMIAGLAGGIFYHDVGAERITPESMEILQMALVIAYAVIGGMESILSSAIGAFMSLYLLEALREIPLPFGLTIDGSAVYEPGAWRFALFGLILMLTLRFFRNGLLFPVIQWFDDAERAREETVAKRKAPTDDADTQQETQS